MKLILVALAIVLCITFSSHHRIGSQSIQPKFHHRRILKGDEVPIEKYPFALAYIFLEHDNPSKLIQLDCGASVVQKYWAITTAVCAQHVTMIFSWNTVLRGNTSFIKGPDATNHWVMYAYRHEEYLFRESNMNNIGLLNVIEPFDGVNEAAIPLAPPNYEYKIGSTARILGWGYTDAAITRESMVLRAGDVKLMDTNVCRNVYTWYNYQNNGPLYVHVSDKTTICAKALYSGDCEGDTGGAVIQNGKLIGIISSRVGCGSERFPSVYMKVSAFYDWIYRHVNGSNGFGNMNV